MKWVVSLGLYLLSFGILNCYCGSIHEILSIEILIYNIIFKQAKFRHYTNNFAIIFKS